MKNIFVLLICFFTFSCSTIPYDDPTFGSPTHVHDEALGFSHQKVSEDYYLITYKTKVVWAFSSYEDSWRAWDTKAKEICGADNFVRRYEKETMGNSSPPGWLQTVSAHVDCSGHAEQDMISKQLEDEQNKKNKYEQLSIQKPCNVTVTAENIDDIYIWAHEFYKYKLFKSSRSCFMKVLEFSPDNSESLEHLATIYQNGYGVEKDTNKAKLLLQKSKHN